MLQLFEHNQFLDNGLIPKFLFDDCSNKGAKD